MWWGMVQGGRGTQNAGVQRWYRQLRWGCAHSRQAGRALMNGVYKEQRLEL